MSPSGSSDTAGDDGNLPLLIVLASFLLIGFVASWAGYAHFGRPTLRGHLESAAGGRAYDLESRHSRTWWRRPLTLGGPDDDIDLGLGGRWARIIPRRNGECFLEAVSADGVVVDDHLLGKGLRSRLYDCSEIQLGPVELQYRSP